MTHCALADYEYGIEENRIGKRSKIRREKKKKWKGKIFLHKKLVVLLMCLNLLWNIEYTAKKKKMRTKTY